MGLRGTIHLKYSKFLERYTTGNKVHIVDFNNSDGKASLGKIISTTDTMLICKLDQGYNVAITFAELKSGRYGMTVIN